jgi:acetoacetyl-CoA synthetase
MFFAGIGGRINPPSAGDRMNQSSAPHEESILWVPTAERVRDASLTRYRLWLGSRGVDLDSYAAMWEWSVREPEAFWASICEFFGASLTPYTTVIERRGMPGTRWFVGAEVNYAERALLRRDSHLALIYVAENGTVQELTYQQLYDLVSRAAAGLRRLGVVQGDRVVGYLPNCVEAVVAFLASASIGAIWSCCSPDFGTQSVVDRFRQIEPRVLIAADGYFYNGRIHSRTEEVWALNAALSSVSMTVLVNKIGVPVDGTLTWDELCAHQAPLSFTSVDFDHPLWILYSSGTTGLPKAIVQGHGGILVEHLKALGLHFDIQPSDRFFWFTTTGWMMWNFLLGGLLHGATVVLYDGSATFPDLTRLWRLVDELGVTYFGTSAGLIQACMRADLRPREFAALTQLRSVGVTASPLPSAGFRWVYESVKADIHLGSASGGTDVCTPFVGPSPILPVYAGELQCRLLGVDAAAFNEAGVEVIDEVGELVVRQAMPSMPLRFWNDPAEKRYRESYFETFPGVWRHGDFISFNKRGGCVIYGRSDSTLNRLGIRIGTSEFYRVLEELPEIEDSLVVDTGQLGNDGKLVLFVVLVPGLTLTDSLKSEIGHALQSNLSPRHRPDAVYAVSEIPRTLNGKKLEVPIKRILQGIAVSDAIALGAVSNPASLVEFERLAGNI